MCPDVTPLTRTLLSNLIDYAGLFPPAEVSMSRAVSNYAEYASGNDSWALGRLIVPCMRLEEFAAASRELGVERAWRLSALAGSDLDADIASILKFNAASVSARVDAIELKASSKE